MAPDYLAYLEERLADPSLATLIRLAGALGMTVASLRGVGIEAPPGPCRRTPEAPAGAYFQPFFAMRSKTVCQSSNEAFGTRTPGNGPIKSGPKKHFTSSHSRSVAPPCRPGVRAQGCWGR